MWSRNLRPVRTSYRPRPSSSSRTRMCVSVVRLSMTDRRKDVLQCRETRPGVIGHAGRDAHTALAARLTGAVAHEDASCRERFGDRRCGVAHLQQDEVGLARPVVQAAPFTQLINGLTRLDR